MAITRGARNDVVPYRNYADAPSTTDNNSQPVSLPSNADQYDELQVFAQADSNQNNSGVYFQVPVPRFTGGRVSSSFVRVAQLLQPDFLFSNNRQVQLSVRLQSGVYQVRATSNQSGATFRPRILMVRLVSWAGVD